MSKRKRKVSRSDEPVQSKPQIGYVLGDTFADLTCTEYTSLDQCPEIVTAVKTIADLIGSMTIHLMANTSQGDVRIQNELSRVIDINPERNMTRQQWMSFIVSTMMLYGKGNAIVMPHTWEGLLQSLEPIAADRVELMPRGTSRRDYDVYVDGIKRSPENVLHFVYNPDKRYPWKGAGVTVPLRNLAKMLKQARKTEEAFMSSKWKPSIIVRVDSTVEAFSTPEGRRKVLDDYVRGTEAGEPWLIPGEQFQVEQVRPLTLADLAINDTVEIDKRTVAGLLGVPPFLLGVGEYKRDEWNAFIRSTIATIATGIQQELTRKLILSDKWYLKFNVRNLMDWDLNSLYSVYGGLSDKGIVTGNEVRNVMGMSPKEGLDELRILENYIPADRIGDQAKLNGGTE